MFGQLHIVYSHGFQRTVMRDWLKSEIEIDIVAIGIAATMLSLAVFTIEDVSILFTGNLIAFRAPRIAFYSLAAALAALFCGVTIFISRPGLHRIVISLLSISIDRPDLLVQKK